jgi:hypothetical protein
LFSDEKISTEHFGTFATISATRCGEQERRHADPVGYGGSQIQYRLDLRELFDWQIS